MNLRDVLLPKSIFGKTPVSPASYNAGSAKFRNDNPSLQPPSYSRPTPLEEAPSPSSIAGLYRMTMAEKGVQLRTGQQELTYGGSKPRRILPQSQQIQPQVDPLTQMMGGIMESLNGLQQPQPQQQQELGNSNLGVALDTYRQMTQQQQQ